MTDDRCPVCDRVKATQEHWDRHAAEKPDGADANCDEGGDCWCLGVCWGGCDAYAVDWRDRCKRAAEWLLTHPNDADCGSTEALSILRGEA